MHSHPAHRPVANDNSLIGCTSHDLAYDWSLPMPISLTAYVHFAARLLRSFIEPDLFDNNLRRHLHVSYENVKFAASDVIRETLCQRLLLVEYFELKIYENLGGGDFLTMLSKK